MGTLLGFCSHLTHTPTPYPVPSRSAKVTALFATAILGAMLAQVCG